MAAIGHLWGEAEGAKRLAKPEARRQYHIKDHWWSVILDLLGAVFQRLTIAGSLGLTLHFTNEETETYDGEVAERPHPHIGRT